MGGGATREVNHHSVRRRPLLLCATQRAPFRERPKGAKRNPKGSPCHASATDPPTFTVASSFLHFLFLPHAHIKKGPHETLARTPLSILHQSFRQRTEKPQIWSLKLRLRVTSALSAFRLRPNTVLPVLDVVDRKNA